MPNHPVERKLAAIFAADIAGYSRLMARDEIGTLGRLKACRAIIDELIASHRGRIFNTAGDSVVADFASAVDAVQCAVAVQAAMTTESAQYLNCGRSLDKFPEVVSRLKGVLERFADALSCIDQCFIADEMLEHLPVASQVGKTLVGGIDLNKPRMRQVIEALIALSPSPNGFTASDVAARVRALSKQTPSQYGPRHAAYDLKKLRGKQILRRIPRSRRYEPLPAGLRAMTALLVLRNKAIKPLLAAAQPLRPTRGAHNPKPIDAHYHAIRVAMHGVFHELGLAA